MNFQRIKSFFSNFFTGKNPDNKVFINQKLGDYEKSYKFEKLVESELNMAYLERGEGKNVILFLHGMTEDALNWFYSMEFLYIKSKDFRLIAVDLPGFGQTKGADLKIELDFYANAVKEFLDKKKIEKVMLVGHSMGGHTALLFYKYFPDMVDSIALAANAGFRRVGDFTSKILKALPVPGLFLKNVSLLDWFKLLNNNAVLQNLEYFKKIMYELVMSRKNSLTEFFIERNYERLVDDGLDRINITKKAMDAMMESKYFIDDILSDLEIPVAFIWGEDDYLVPLRYAYKGYDLIKHENKELFVFKKTGHYTLLERPREFAEVLFKFCMKYKIK